MSHRPRLPTLSKRSTAALGDMLERVDRRIERDEDFYLQQGRELDGRHWQDGPPRCLPMPWSHR